MLLTSNKERKKRNRKEGPNSKQTKAVPGELYLVAFSKKQTSFSHDNDALLGSLRGSWLLQKCLHDFLAETLSATSGGRKPGCIKGHIFLSKRLYTRRKCCGVSEFSQSSKESEIKGPPSRLTASYLRTPLHSSYSSDLSFSLWLPTRYEKESY